MTVPAQMTAVVLTGHGGLDKLDVRTVDTPSPNVGEVLIKVGACGLNNTDVNTRTAWYSSGVTDALGDGVSDGFNAAKSEDGSWGSLSLSFPVIQGADVVGRIVDVGAGVSRDRIGQRVVVDPWLLGHGDWQNPENTRFFGSETDGGFADYTTIRAENALPVASDLSDAELATFACAYTTAEYLISRTAPVPGETVVITGASGGVGSAAIQLCKLRGCVVVAVASASKHEALKNLGADHTIDRNTTDVEHSIRTATDGDVDIVIDVVGGDNFLSLLRVLRQGGRYSASGCIAGQMTEMDLRLLIYKDLQLTGATIAPAGTMQRVLRMVEEGQLRPLLAATYPLAKLADAQAEFIAKAYVGNIVVVP